jgi:CheY-like chemotaxis protein
MRLTERVEGHLKVLRVAPIISLEEHRLLANRVLLVDDDEVVRMTVTGLLEQSGFAVTFASNVMEALKRITS